MSIRPVSKDGKYTMPYKTMIALWDFYQGNVELFRAGEILIEKSINADFSFQWGMMEQTSVSYDAMKSSLEAVKDQNKAKGKEKKGDEGRATLFDIMEDRRESKQRRKKKEEDDKSRKAPTPGHFGSTNGETSQKKLGEKLTNLDSYMIYKDLMMKMKAPEDVASDQQVQLTQYTDKKKEKATGVGAGKLPKGDVDHRGDIKQDVDKNIVASIASIASGELPHLISSKSAIVTSDDSPQDIRWMREFMKEALKYKLIFGMVPYSAGLDESGRKRLFVREISEGEFVVYRDKNSQIQGYWQHRDDTGDTGAKGGRSYLFIWPDSKPNIHKMEAPFSSPTFRLLSDWYTLLNTKNNKLDADWLSAHVPVVTKCTEQLAGINEMTSEGVFNRLLGRPSGQSGLANNSAQKASVDAESARRSLLLAGMMNNQKAKTFVMRNIQKEISESGAVQEISRGMSWDDQKMPLSFGREPASITLPKSPEDYTELKKMFEEIVSMTLGVPLREVSGETRARTTIGEEGIQKRFDDALELARIHGALCLQETFTIAFGEQESLSIKKGLDNAYGAMSDEMRAINYYETIYGMGLDNPAKPEKMKREQDAAMLNNYIYGKAFEVMQLAMDDAVTLDPATVRQHIREMVTIHKQNVETLERRVNGLWDAHKSDIRLTVQWKPGFSKELMSLLVEGYNIGFIDKEPGALFYLDAMGYPLDTPRGKEKEERMERVKAYHTKEMEKMKQSHEIEKIRLQGKISKEMERLKATLAPKLQPSPTGSSSSKQGEKRKEKSASASAKPVKKAKTSNSDVGKSITETTPTVSKKAKNPEKEKKQKT